MRLVALTGWGQEHPLQGARPPREVANPGGL
jgi:hypothetical protein